MQVAFETLYLLTSLVYISGVHGGVLTEKVNVQCPLLNIRDVPVQQNFDIYQFTGVWYVHATTTFIFGDETGESKIRDIIREESGKVSIALAGYYPHVEQHCISGKRPNATEYGEPGKYKDVFNDFYIVVYTDYQYAITYICFDNNNNEKCEHGEMQIEIWSRTKDLISDRYMQELESKAASHLCVNTSDFETIELGFCDPSELFSSSTNESETHNCDSTPCQQSGLCIEEDENSYQCFCPTEYSGMNCEITCPIKAITRSMAQSGFDINRFEGLWYVHALATSTGNLTTQSMFRDVEVFENGNVSVRYGGYDLKSKQCIQSHKSGLLKGGKPGWFQYGANMESVYTYTDYHYTIMFLLLSTTSDGNEERFETQVEIWSKSKDPIPREFMRYLERKAEQILCVQTVDFEDQELGLCDSFLKKSKN